MFSVKMLLTNRLPRPPGPQLLMNSGASLESSQYKDPLASSVLLNRELQLSSLKLPLYIKLCQKYHYATDKKHVNWIFKVWFQTSAASSPFHVIKLTFLAWSFVRKCPGGVFLGIPGRGVPPVSPNPDPISDQRNVIFHIRFHTLPLKSIPISRPSL